MLEMIIAQREADKERNERILTALKVELREIDVLLPQKKELLTKLRNSFATNQYYKIISIPFPTDIYRSNRTTIYAYLKEGQISSLRLLYSYLSIIDEDLKNIPLTVEKSVATFNPIQMYGGAQMRMDTLLNVADKALDLSRHLSTGSKILCVHCDTHVQTL